MSEQREALAEALHDVFCDLPRACVCNPNEMLAEADALLDSPALAQMLADAEQRGADRVAAAVEALAEEWERTTVRSRLAFLVAADELRAALTTGAADRVRAEEGNRG